MGNAWAAGQQSPGAVAKEEKKPAVDLLALFKFHYENRVRSFKEQNQAYQNVVLVGDSITEGFEVSKYFPGRRVLNRGIGGDVIGNALPPDDPRGVLKRLDASVFDCAATDVFLMIGINDLNTGRDPASMEVGYRTLLEKIKRHSPTLRVHVQSLLPTRGAHAARNAPVREFNTRLAKVTAEYGYDFLNLHPLFTDAQGELKAELTADGLHLNEAAYRVWRAEIIRVLGWPAER
ncbi:MAG: GDSL-type esterase/lipase family protein [Actinomycetota bacterium]